MDKLDLEKNRVFFPYEVDFGGKRRKNSWFAIQNGKAWFFHRRAGLIVEAISGADILEGGVEDDDKMTATEIKKRKKVRKTTSQYVLQTSEGEVILRDRGGCGCSHPLKGKKTVEQVRSAAAKAKSQKESKVKRDKVRQERRKLALEKKRLRKERNLKRREDAIAAKAAKAAAKEAAKVKLEIKEEPESN